MIDRLYLGFGIVTLLFCMFIIFLTELSNRETTRLLKACELAEISADFTPQEKAQCRILRRQVR